MGSGPAHSRLFRLVRIDRTLRLLWDAAPRLTVANGLLILGQSAIPALSLYLLKRIVDSVAAGLAPGAGLGHTAVLHALTLVALAAAVALLGSVLQSVGAVIEEAHSQRVTNWVQDLLHTKSIEVDLAFYEDSRYYDALHRAQQEAPLRPPLILRGMLRTARNAASLVSVGMLILLSLNWIFLAVLVVTALPVVWLRVRYADYFYRWRRRRTETERRIWYLNLVLTGGWNAKEIRTFGLGGLLSGWSKRLRGMLFGERVKIARKRAGIDVGAQAGQTAVTFAAVAYLVVQAVQGAVSVGSLVMLYQALQRGSAYLQGMLEGLSDLYENSLFLSNLYEFLKIEPKVAGPKVPRPFPSPIRNGIAFRRVRFTYPGSQRETLREVSFSIRPGELMALVGMNGAGKSTLVRLLARLYDPDGGEITIDGIDIRSLPLAELRSKLGILFQDFGDYQFRMWENIWFGDVSREPDRERIAFAAHAAGAQSIVDELPKGYETQLGRWFDEGEELSAGQWKKLALARVLYRRSPIIVLDEPESSLDPESEARLVRTLRDLAAEGRMVLVTSHHMSITRAADSVIVLEEGRIVEHGVHEELIEVGGAYAHLYDEQIRNIKERL